MNFTSHISCIYPTVLTSVADRLARCIHHGLNKLSEIEGFNRAGYLFILTNTLSSIVWSVILVGKHRFGNTRGVLVGMRKDSLSCSRLKLTGMVAPRIDYLGSCFADIIVS